MRQALRYGDLIVSSMENFRVWHGDGDGYRVRRSWWCDQLDAFVWPRLKDKTRLQT
jgi:hypothetical protein